MFNQRVLLLAAFLSVQLLVTTTVGASVSYVLARDKVPEGLTFGGLNLGGLTQSEALQLIEQEIPQKVSFEGRVFPLDTSYSRQRINKWLQEQFAPVTGFFLTDAFRYLGNTVTGSQLELLSRDEILPQLQKLRAQINREGRKAALMYENGSLILKEGYPGLELDVEKSWEKLQFARGNNSVPLEVKVVEVHPNNADLKAVRDKLGDYTTYFNPLDQARTNNVRLAARALDNLLIPPGGEFSFNGVVGERARSAGYLPAYIYSDNRIVLGDGGGVCQDSTTLYLAVRQANLEIIERNSHSLSVSYAPRGEDATVAYGLLDFRFRNDTNGYLLISAKTGSNWVRIRLFGISDTKHPSLARPDGYPVKPEDFKDPK